MATTCFLLGAASVNADQVSLGTNQAKLAGGTVGWVTNAVGLARGSGQITSDNTATVTGTTVGIEALSSSLGLHWISPPLDRDITIAGTITLNIWAAENNMSANVAINAYIDRVDSTGAVVSRVATTARITEVAVSPVAVNNFTVTPTSTNFLKGDRIRVVLFGDDAGTMASGFTFAVSFGGTTGGAAGDSFVTFTETFGFLTTDPTTTTLYPTTTASDIDPGGGGTDTKAAWTARGSGATVIQRALTAGWTAPLQWTVSGGGNLVEWYTKPLTAFTLAGPVLANLRALANSVSARSAIRAELAICATDGSSPTVWAATSYPTAIPFSEAAHIFYLAGDDTAVTDGQRLRLRFYADDPSTEVMAVGDATSAGIYYAGTSAAASGDTYLIFGQALTEFAAAKAIPSKRRSIAHLLTR